MSKEYNKKEISQILYDILCGSLDHMEAIKTEIGKIGPISEQSDPNLQARAKVMHLTLTCINDIIHPAHNLLFKWFHVPGKDHAESNAKREEFFRLLVSNQQQARSKGIIPACYCNVCDPDKEKAIARYESLKNQFGKEQVDGQIEDGRS